MRVIPFSVGVIVATILAIAAPASSARICAALPPYTLLSAAQAHPELKVAVDAIKTNPVATWYTDRGGASQVPALLAACQGDIPSIVIYGLPDKDCGEGGFSQGGDNKNTDMYRAWIQRLADQVGQREVIYVLEPDAVGLIAAGGCGVQKGYLSNLKMALGLLSANSRAHIYVDVASWANQNQAVTALNALKSAGRLAGITINTSNYRRTSELNKLCESYSGATGGLHCVFDVSRNYNGSPQNEWCNARSAGVGSPPTDATNHPLVDFHLWIKVPGESDGECTGRSPDAMVGPSAGQFFLESFKTMWNQGYFVAEKGMPQIGGSAAPQPTNAPSTTTKSPAPSTKSPSTTTKSPAPSTKSPSSTTKRPAPSTKAPSTTTKRPAPSTKSPTPDGGVAVYGQCGGKEYSGATKCKQGLVCQAWSEWYSQCIPPAVRGGSVMSDAETAPDSPDSPVELVPAWQQCGGANYAGPTSCVDGFECKLTDDDYLQCVETGPQVMTSREEIVAGWLQCGGANYTGSSRCVEGFVCMETDDDFRQCVTVQASPSSVDEPAPNEAEEQTSASQPWDDDTA